MALIVAGIAAGVAGVTVAGARYDDGVDKLARAPVGCTTTLQFDDGGTYRLYIETKGDIDGLGGDCGVNGPFEHQGDPPTIDELSVVDAAGDDVPLIEASGTSYDAGGAKGTEIRRLRLDDGGTYRLTLKSESEDFVVAIGKDPEGDASSFLYGGIGLGAILAVIGVVLLVLGLRRRPSPTTSAGGGWTPSTAPPPPPPSSAAWTPQAPPSAPPPPPPSNWGAPG